MSRRGAMFASLRITLGYALVLGATACSSHEREPGPKAAVSAPIEHATTASPNSESPLLTQANALRTAGKIVEARALIEASMPSFSPNVASRARAMLARISLAQGDVDGAIAGLRRGMNEASARGNNKEAVYDGTALAYTLVSRKHAYDDARVVLSQLEASSKNDPASLAIVPHYAGLIALDTGDLREALTLFRKAITLTRALDLRDHELLARQNEAQTLSLLGRHVEAIAAQREIVSRVSSDDACRVVDAQEQLLWLVIVSEAPNGSEQRVVGQQAADAAQRAMVRCQTPARLRNHAINLGLFALQAGDVVHAQSALDELTRLKSQQDATLGTWELELRGRWWLAKQSPKEAETMFRRALDQSRSAALWDSELLAQQGLGRSLEDQGKLREAAAAYTEAEHWMDKLLGSVPMGEGQTGFLHEREQGTERLIALLLRAKDARQALLVARNARARVLRANSHPALLSQLTPDTRRRFEAALARFQGARSKLEAEQARAWMLPKDQLAKMQAANEAERQAALGALDEAQALLQGESASASKKFDEPSKGTALLALVPLADSVAVFVSFAGKTEARVVSAVDLHASPEVLGAQLLEPSRRVLDKAGKLEVLTQGDLASLDVHAFVVDGEPATKRWTFSYKLDLAAAVAQYRTDESALVVSNPKEDLPFAEREGEAVAQALSLANVPTVRLVGAQASRAHVLDALAHATLFHYAGHGVFAGHEGIDSGLRLADGELSLGDILAQPRVPQDVVLSACEGARERTPGLAAGLSIAQAFIARGAHAVIAATREVGDAETRTLIDAFYAARRAQPKLDAAGVLRIAQLQLRESMPTADWSSFRVLTP